MSIIIPSKYIYDLSNPKVRDNVYKKVEVNAHKAVADNEFDVTVADFTENTEKYFTDLDTAKWSETLDAKYNEYTDTYEVEAALATAGARAVYVDREFVIDIKKDKSYISYLKALFDDEINAYNITLQCRKFVGASSVYTEGFEFKYHNPITYALPENENPIISSSFDDVLIEKSEWIYGEPSRAAVATIDLLDNSNVEVSGAEIGDSFKISIKNILICYESYIGSVYKTFKYTTGWKPYDKTTIPITAEKLEPVSMKISFQGNTIGIDFEKETISIGEQTSKNALSIAENELIQSTNIYYPPFKHYYARNYEVVQLEKTYSQRVKVQFIHNGTKSEQYIAAGNQSTRIHNPSALPFEVVSVTFTSNEISEFYKHILDEYNKGKETATLTCTMSQYLDTSGEVAIDAGAYNLVDFAHWSEDGDRIVFDPIANEIRYPYTNMLSNLDFSLTIDGTSSPISIVGSRYEAKTLFSNKSKITIWATMFDYEGEEYDYTIHIDPSYLPSGKFSLSFEMNVYDGVVVLANVQINKGKARPYQKHLKMHFSEGDIVIPMKYTSSGTDVGISLYNNDINTPKQFKVTGVELFYDGVTRQKLTLQEV